ncbi:MupA/Atu3671 family FMN-dependent luciferase-like monooxygenase [Streptomyces sp. NPDC006208]|uniref:MupA/Atu3671 family FMN-dependent luciferase-like monooxygenase n=1 Tax=Streptomyces sp. NPDC006208 TaxID=3156734 RepID=UPI0033B8F2E7
MSASDIAAEATARAAEASARLTEQLAEARMLRAAAPASGAAEVHGPQVTLPAESGMAGDGADAAQRAHTEDLIRRYTARTRTSKALVQRHRPVLADSRAVVGFRRGTKEMLYPLAARSARGARLTDVDGNDYTDITMGFGALLFGHEPEFVTEAVRRHLAGGLRLGPRSTETGEAAELLAGLTGLERVAFAGSGTEANSAAVRLARAATGRDRIVMFRGSYHGHADSVLGRPGPDGATAIPVSRGIPDSAVAELIVLEYGSQESLETIDALADRVAAVLVEPVQCRNPGLQPVAFLRALRDLTTRRGIVLLFDEMLTGLRPHPRGAQHHYGVVPDLATYGKALGSGFPIGAIAGRADILDGIDGGSWQYGDDSRPLHETTFFGGTYIQHPVSMAAARAVLTHLTEHGPGLQERLNARTGALADELNRFFLDEEFPLEVAHFGSMFRFTHRADMELLYYHLLLRGIYVWEWRSFYLSTAHTDSDIERIGDAVKDSLRELRGAGFFPATRRSRQAAGPGRRERGAPDFGVYFFGDYPETAQGGAAGERPEDDKYGPLVETARFADSRGFSTLWLPERHFHTFGGLFPNPAVLASALARETSRIRLNAGSVVLPLHDPVRVAEEWSMADNLSGGRVGLGCATGWHEGDFVFHPDRFERRKEIAFDHLDEVRRLWRGDSVRRRTGEGRESDVRIQPRPVQGMPPMFLATSGQRASYTEAARRDLGIVTNLMNQSVDELAENVHHYRRVRAEHGLDPEAGRVTVLLHTYLAEEHEAARADALEPMSRYLRSSLQMRSAATAFGSSPQDVATASEDDLDYLFRRAYDRYCDQRALIGTPDSCAGLVDALHAAGVDEIAALVDFGMSPQQLRAGLEQLDILRRRYHGPTAHPPTGTASDPARPGQADGFRGAGAGGTVTTPGADGVPLTAAPPAVPGLPDTGGAAGPERTVPATAAQRRLWLAARLIGNPAAYNEIQSVRLRGPLDVPALRAAVDGLVARHPVLHTVFRTGDGAEPLLQVVRPALRSPLRVTDARGRDAEDVLAEAQREETERPYDLAEGPLFTPRLIRLADDDQVLLLGMHHIVTDAHSAGIVADDLQELYRAAAEQREPVFTRSASEPGGDPGPGGTGSDLAWWREHIGDKPPVLSLPTDRPRRRTVAGRGGAVAVRLGRERTTRLQEWSGRQGVTLFATLLTAWQIVLRKRSGQDEFIVGTTFGRRTERTRDCVGFQVALLPLRTSLADSTPLAEAVRATRNTLLDAAERQYVDLDALLTGIHPDPGNPRPLITVSADLDTEPLTRLDLPGLAAGPVGIGTASAPLELALMATRTADGLALRVRYDADLFDAGTVRGLLDQLEQVLAALGGAATGRVGELLGGPAGAGRPPVAQALREAWESVLGVAGFPEDANFFDLGGNSISAIRLVNRVRDTLDADFPLADFFADATLRAMVVRLAADGPAPSPRVQGEL